MPPVPAFYAHPTSVADIVDHVVMRALDQFGLRVETQPRWNGALLQRVTAGTDV
jgi:4-hydroxy-3-polyprenylbenzoate decarboxylase